MSKQENILSHRTLVFEGFSASVSTFYTLIEQAVASRAIPGAKVRHIWLSEGGLLGAKREYLRISRKGEEFLISGASFGESFMVTWWLRKIKRPWLKWLLWFILVCSVLDRFSERLYMAVVNFFACSLVPVVFVLVVLFFLRRIPGARLIWRFSKAVLGWGWKAFQLPTLFERDSATAFQSAVPSLVEHVIQMLRSAQGLRAIGGEALRVLPPLPGRS